MISKSVFVVSGAKTDRQAMTESVSSQQQSQVLNTIEQEVFSLKTHYITYSKIQKGDIFDRVPTRATAEAKMKIQLTLFLLAILAAFAFAQAPQVPVVVSYPEDTPQSVLEDAMDAIRKAVGCDSASDMLCE